MGDCCQEGRSAVPPGSVFRGLLSSHDSPLSDQRPPFPVADDGADAARHGCWRLRFGAQGDNIMGPQETRCLSRRGVSGVARNPEPGLVVRFCCAEPGVQFETHATVPKHTFRRQGLRNFTRGLLHSSERGLANIRTHRQSCSLDGKRSLSG